MKVHCGSKVEPKVQRCELQSSHLLQDESYTTLSCTRFGHVTLYFPPSDLLSGRPPSKSRHFTFQSLRPEQGRLSFLTPAAPQLQPHPLLQHAATQVPRFSIAAAVSSSTRSPSSPAQNDRSSSIDHEVEDRHDGAPYKSSVRKQS